MNKGDGTFKLADTKEELEQIKVDPGEKKLSKLRIFEKGEELIIKDSRFKVKSIGKRELHLTLLPDLNPEESEEETQCSKEHEPMKYYKMPETTFEELKANCDPKASGFDPEKSMDELLKERESIHVCGCEGKCTEHTKIPESDQ